MPDTNPQTLEFRRRHLPHWFVSGRAYFVTIRLKGSLPQAVTEHLVQEREAFAARHPSDEERTALQRIQFKRIEAILDSAKESPTFLNTVPVAALVFRAFEWLEAKKRWLIYAATIMPNHVHLLMRHRGDGDGQLNRDLGVLKGFTAHEANKCLGRTGQPFWMDESFDHWCRTDEELRWSVGYIAQNPVKAGLAGCWKAWPWTLVRPEYVADAESGLAGQAGMPDIPASCQAGMPDLPASCQAGMPDLPASCQAGMPDLRGREK